MNTTLIDAGPHIRVGQQDGQVRGTDNRAIQLAVNALPPRGGTVEILPGTYTCLDAIHLRSNVHLVGHGERTVLRKCNGARSALKIDADYGQLKITPQSTTGFLPGMGLLVGDSRTSGWLETATTILDIDHGVLRVADHLAMDYAARRQGWVSNACSLISGRQVENVTIENLTIEGNKEQNEQMNGCRGGAIYLYKAKRCTIRGCTVRDYHGDGISIQITQDTTIEDCTVRGCTHIGMHPGTGSAGVRMRRCTFSDNAEGGFYLCWRVQEGIWEDVVCERNGVYGISIGHKDTDNRFVRCIVRDNGQYGIVFRDEELYNGAHRNTWIECRIQNNGTGDKGIAIWAQGQTHDNRFQDCILGGAHANMQASQRIGISLGPDTRRFEMKGCTWKGFTQRVVDQTTGKGAHRIDITRSR